MAELVLRSEKVLVGAAADGVACQAHLPPRQVLDQICHGDLEQGHQDHLRR